MEYWKLIEGRIMNAVSGVVFSQYGGVCFGVDYLDETGEILLRIFDKSMRCEDKELIVNERYKYNFEYDTCKDVHDIVVMLETEIYSM